MTPGARGRKAGAKARGRRKIERQQAYLSVSTGIKARPARVVTAALTHMYANTVKATTKPVNVQGLETEPLLSTRTSLHAKEGLRRVRRSAPLIWTTKIFLTSLIPHVMRHLLTQSLMPLQASYAPARAMEKCLEPYTGGSRRNSQRERQRLSLVERAQLLGTLLHPHPLPLHLRRRQRPQRLHPKLCHLDAQPLWSPRRQ